eukprot:CAMPEP_0178516236 /NCGR_PEP_ID=MMETSP0696-20121128/24997_1 /TAXON_ID=265572 /ORGANISM="Extubocellulus spinifer, Strain CCMP396" /LENGTH=198 /DNA_ID=CAMNT_0020146481 /DNA_START=55 /DNA_END=651 /DNA_ORIENTATION=+
MSDWIIPLIATGLSGIVTGSLAFASAVDTRSFLLHLSSSSASSEDQDEEEKKAADDDDGATGLIVKHFQVWWPCGRDWMVPLIGTTTLANLAAWFVASRSAGGSSSATASPSTWCWGAAATMIGLIGPYTGFVLMEDIDKLRTSSTEEVEVTTRRFCNLHHPRLGMALVGYGFALFGLASTKGLSGQGGGDRTPYITV